MTPDDYQFMNDTLIIQAGEMEITLQQKDERIRDLEAQLVKVVTIILTASIEDYCPWCGKLDYHLPTCSYAAFIAAHSEPGGAKCQEQS